MGSSMRKLGTRKVAKTDYLFPISYFRSIRKNDIAPCSRSLRDRKSFSLTEVLTSIYSLDIWGSPGEVYSDSLAKGLVLYH